MADATTLDQADLQAELAVAPRRRSRFSNLLATASMASWAVLAAMPIAAAIAAFT